MPSAQVARFRLAPTFIGASAYALITADVFGGKAASLAELRRLGLSVPSAWAFPCSASIERPLLEFPAWNAATNYSVRSGAPVSMPGMLKTQLGVNLSGIRSAIRAVWDSWDEPHARLYREINGISHTLGTGCIVQEMPEGITYSGVAFTSQPGDYVNRLTFDPVIEAVKGTGDALVGGESSGIRLTDDNPVISSSQYDALIHCLNKIHKGLGPSDIEWCATNNGYLSFLQWRPLKFAPPEPAEEDAGRTVVAFGRSIASKRVVIARLATPDVFTEGDILYVDAFKPEVYPLMMKAAAIVTIAGGETCHAAIVARTMNLPAVSGIPAVEVAEYIGKRIRLNGSTGTLTLPQETGEVVEVASATTVVTTIAPVTPNLRHRTRKWTAEDLLLRFYKAINDKEAGVITADRLEVIANEIAQVFTAYQYSICCAECRWSAGLTKTGRPSDNENAQTHITRLQGLGVPLADLGHCRGERSSFAAGLQQPPTLAHAIDVMENVSAIFNEFYWGANPGAGGPKWGAITDHLLRYLRGDLPTILYIDGNFNQQHNGGLYFNKFDWMRPGNSLMPYLDAKQRGFNSLCVAAGSSMESLIVTADSIFSDGLPGPSCESIPLKWGEKNVILAAASESESEEDEDEAEADLSESYDEEESDINA